MLSQILHRIKEGAALIWYEQEEECLLCSNLAKEIICQSCRDLYFRPELNRCNTCGKLIGDNKIRCSDCQEGKGPKCLTRATALGHYSGAWKDLIQNVKFRGQPYLLAYLRGYVDDWVIKNFPPPDVIIPVPMHHSRIAQRGFNQADVLASILSGQLGIEYQDALYRNRATTAQTSLGRHERLNNVQGAFSLKKDVDIKGRIIWLVDDVVTTGTTLDECAKALREHGASDIYGICLAAGIEEILEK
ncbi:MAG: hypothetical protein APF84_05035 [Gracilibacter sp. BRH_c7a]|nr:MAG: hypothetical protein APF84_05035 [Gracilibacter sp. BRH_c7a]